MLLHSLFYKLISLIFCVIFLSQCTKVADAQLQVNQPVSSPYTMPADAYLALAKKQDGIEKQSLLMMAAGRLIYDGQWQQGETILSQTSDLSADLAREKSLLLAKVDLIRQQPRAAIAKLAAVREINSMPSYYQAQFHEMLAQSYQATGSAPESVAERIKLERLLSDDTMKTNNLRALWLTLTTLPMAELDTLAAETPVSSELGGWMQLSLISRKNNANAQTMMSEIEQWQARYPQHPANTILPLASVTQHLLAPPKRMAVLLPLTGPLAGPGGAIRDGFMAAYKSGKGEVDAKVQFYNTDSAKVADLYNQAVTEGADYIVGPLSKADVVTVAAMNHPVPTLLLNDVNNNTSENAYEFGLSPSNEARQVAAKAHNSGHTRALVIAPDGPWGEEVATAFKNQWQTGGGLVVDTFHYRAKDDMNKEMRDFLQISDSEARSKKLKQLLGQHIESTPRRRQDFDMIFLLAYPSKARQIMPMLKYYYAGDVPVYATSNVYAGSANAMKDRDLNGIIFCDMPWVFAHQMGNKNWPEQFNSYNRLYALGMDSYALATQLNQLLLFPAMGVNNKSGVLYLNPNQQIARVLNWGQFRQGLAQLTRDNPSAA